MGGAGLLAVLVGFAPWARALAPAQALTQYQSRSWGPENGLPCNDVLAVTQASDGYLWLGTEEGLVRFDGVRARVFDRQTDPVLGGNNVSSVREDARHPGRLLLGSAGGVALLADGKIQAFSADGVLAGQPGRVILQDPADGALWVKTLRGLFWVGPDGQEVSGPLEAASGWPVETIQTVCRDGVGRLWVGTVQGLYRQHAGTRDEGLRFDLLLGWADKAIDCLLPARGGGLWVGSRNAGTGRLDGDGAFHPRAALAGCVVNALLEDHAGMLWVGTHGSGLFRLPAGEDLGAGSEGEVLTADKGLVHNQVNGLCEDREGNLWVATVRGLQVLRDTRFLNFGRPEGLAGDDVRTVFGDDRGRLWMGHEHGLSMLAPGVGGTGEVTNYPLPPSPRRPNDSLVLCVGPGDAGDTLLAGTHAGLVRWRAGRLEPWPVREDLDGSVVRALCVDAAGDQWIGTESGLYQVRGNQVLARLTTAGGLAADRVRVLHADRRGNLWIGTDDGLSRRGPDGRIVNFLGSEAGRAAVAVFALCDNPEDEDDLFVGTEFGLHRLRLAADASVRITRYAGREGLVEGMLWSVLNDGKGNLWMSSNKGISRVARADLVRFDRGQITTVPLVTYGAADGLRSREANGGAQPVACRDRAGRLWFATVKGAACVDPARIGVNALPPPVQVEELLADGHAMSVSPATPGENAPVSEVAAGTQKFDLRYTALSLVAPENNRFRTRLEPFDAGWTNAGTERVAHYTNLPPGLYRFHVQAANADGVWNEVGAALAFRLRPFPYQTWWFQTLAVGTIVTLAWAWQHRRRRRWQARLAHAEAELEERTRHQAILQQAREQAEQARAEAEGAQVEAENARAQAEGEHDEAEVARAEAERANLAKSEFLSRMSHELRTPLNAILGFGQLLELDVLSPSQTQSVEHILGGGRHLLGLVDDILDLARIEKGEAILRPEAFALAPLLAEIAGLIAPLVRERDVRLRVADPANVHVHADRQRLKQVLLNLLSNAVKYNRPTGGEVVVEVEESFSPAPESFPCHRISIRDTGAGIDAEGLAKLFTPFERLGEAYGPIEGTGLGLTVSKQLVEAMNGTIGVESTPGVGSTFWVELPASAPPAETSGALPLLPTTGATAAARPSPLAISPAEAGGPSLLYIEDNLSNRQFVASVVAQHRPDLVLRCAPDGHAGLAAARTLPSPGLILLDLQLPDGSGEVVLLSLRAEAATRDIPVVILSADATARSRARLLGLGADGYFTKPLDLPRLLDLLTLRLPPARPETAWSAHPPQCARAAADSN